MSIEQFEQQQYINLETFRKSGEGVKTPVWFAMEEGILYTRTMANSWKIKRLNRDPRIKVTPSDARGEPLGTWVDGRAYEINDSDKADHVNALMNKKYGLFKRGFDLMGIFRGRQMTAVRIEIEP
jgi:PPOX class probable F420-dependent enzyme